MKSRVNLCLPFLLLVVASLVPPKYAFARLIYQLTDLGTLGGTASYAYGINNLGQVVGYSFTSEMAVETQRGFRTQANAAINPATDNLGTLGGFSSFAAAINDLGQVVGSSYLAGNAASHAFRTQPNAAIDSATDGLGTLGGSQSSAWGINNSGEVVGNSFLTGDRASRAFRTSANAPISPATDNLGTLGGSESGAWGINDRGQVVGYSYLAGSSVVHAFRASGGAPIIAADDIGAAVSGHSDARGINNAGQAVGNAYFAGITLYNAFQTAPNSKLNPLTDNMGRPEGTTASSLQAINASGWSVGYVSTASESFASAVLFDGTSLVELNEVLDSSGVGWNLTNATDINDRFQVVGYGTMGGETRAFRLDLIVPEPTVWLLMLPGMVGWLFMRASGR